MTPRLSVVVPVYNVELFLDECLQSLADQTFTDWEAVVVDDGSTDGSLEIARKWAAKESRIRVVEQQNAGLGAARNTGVLHLSEGSEFLAFVDSDDIVVADAYQRCIASLDKTGSDFVSGNVDILIAGETSPSALHAKRLNKPRERTHISRDKGLLYDRTAWNKVFRRTFWDAHDFAFPVGILYEDAPVTIPAHFRAKAVDVLSEPIYQWRQRTAGAPSITQKRTEPKSVRDRITSFDSVSRFLAAQPGAEYRGYKRWYDEAAITDELPLFWNVLSEAGDEFRQAFMDGSRDFLSRVDPEVLTSLPVPMRLKCHFITEGLVDDVLELVQYERDFGKAIPVARSGLRHYADYPQLNGRQVPVPREVLRLSQELAMRARAEVVQWQQGKLHVGGYAYIRNLDVQRPGGSLRVALLREAGSRRSVAVRMRRTHCAEATVSSWQSLHSYDWSGFTFTLDPDKLKHRGSWQEGTWRLTVGAVEQSLARRSRIKAGLTGSAESPSPHWVAPDVRVVPYISDDHLYIRVERVRAKLTGHEAVGGGIRIDGVLTGDLPAGAVLRLTQGSTGDSFEVPAALHTQGDGSRTFTATVDVRSLDVPGRDSGNPDRTESWTLELAGSGGGAVAIAVAGGEQTPARQYPISGQDTLAWGDRAVYVTGSPTGGLVLRTQPVQGVADTVTRSAQDTLLVEGSLPCVPQRPLSLVLRHSRQAEEHLYPVTVTDGRFRAEFRPVPQSRLSGPKPLRSGRWYVFLREEGSQDSYPVRITPAVRPDMPLSLVANGRDYSVGSRFFDRLYVRSDSDLTEAEAGRYRQRRLRTEVYEGSRTAPLKEQVMYASFNGRQYSDSPRAVFEELIRRGTDIEHLWVVQDGQAEVPPGATALRCWSKEWYAALAESRYIVYNSHLPHWIRRREGQVIVQTWHGTPLKRIAHDIDSVQFADRQYLAKVSEETPQWSFLVSPNRFSTPIMKRAFAYDGEILESGYPRNDLLRAPDQQDRARAVREAIGLPEGKRVVLYAPTWRDDQFYRAGNYKFDMRIDLEEASRALGDDHVLLVRKHANIVDSVPGAGNGFVWDVSDYPEIGELFLISDILITDYSSLMFDFANTGRPMLFFTYDLEHYRDRLRGFYFDFEEKAPGPLIHSSDELIAALRNIDSTADHYAGAYQAFQDLFCDLDDGHAADRVIDRMVQLAAASSSSPSIAESR
ncbi:bifunctional glycosyltransferase/CDP-glycerol:glycerophosphate glycerophosphotransferase [Actinacidiphila paucisporea]|uniref:CDP-glycerol:poly(Glycerophosphate) glycerophosphotransferase n=1 Tax=Actinacidiphila paucisporea TaxID=310782 RepID=A0A1M6X1I0_9ACTN|nr:bifunctional glycosyltransferase/CDP-glycerol:glycerophosphate glycerophosphotransferase [Actinacidiphila paucisporea]SHK99699.1 CDP-glycerol:poly(glycerophosphate) glycerophosphotransferase [Actinacidiphila paucisporea]